MNSLAQDEGSELTDGEYVVSSRNGCPEHFRLLVQRYQRPLFAYLSSRLGNHLEAEEAAQESDKIGASFFTHYLISGLRGAADTAGNGLVTLNEAYSYAFQETLASTEKTQYGPQHPAYDINLSGSGDLVLTDLRSSGARLTVAAYLMDSQSTCAFATRKKAWLLPRWSLVLILSRWAPMVLMLRPSIEAISL